ncbi:MAG: hypothetical protein LRZ96_00570 [Candidatus Pacebacteria bacterium]|nr:hypothetical protein [Candidatus Paceibacterota bacterium]
MDINEIKKLIEAEGGKFIIVEDGKPTMIIMAFDDYQKKLQLRFADISETDESKKPEKQENNPDSLNDIFQGKPGEILKIEDIPF